MPLVKILQHWPSTEAYEVGEVYDITNPETLIAEGKVELATQAPAEPIAPVAEEPVIVGEIVEPAAQINETPAEPETPVEPEAPALVESIEEK